MSNQIHLVKSNFICNNIYVVALTIVTNKNRETVYFEEPIPKINYMKILSCSLYNSWYNLESTGSVVKITDKNNTIIKNVPPGHYN